MQAPAELAGVHPDIAHLSWLVGRWTGIGVVAMPGVEPVRYEEVCEFATDGRPFLEYRSMSWIVDEAHERLRPSHTEAGYWRPAPDNGVEATICNPLGIAEVWIGQVTVANIVNAEITAAKMELHTGQFVHTPTAPRVHSGTRLYGIRDGQLLMAFDMSVGGPETSHVSIQLRRA